MLSRLPSNDDGPLGSAIFSWRSKVFLTSLESRTWPLAHFRSAFSLTVYSVGLVNSADSAMSVFGSAEPGIELSRNG